MRKEIREFLTNKGYYVNVKPYEMISKAREWYRSDFKSDRTIDLPNNETYQILQMPFAKRVCADEANLLELVEVKVEDESTTEYLQTFLKANRFETMIREQAELIPAFGTVGTYVIQDSVEIGVTTGKIFKGGKAKLVYVDGSGIIPLTVQNGEILECAFYGENLLHGKLTGTLVVFTKEGPRYVCDNFMFVISNNEMKQVSTEEFGIAPRVVLGDVKPFSICKNAEVNHLANMEGFGLSKVYNAQSVFRALDIAFTLLNSDLELSRKLLLVNEALAGFDDEGTPLPSNKKQFIFLGERLSGDDQIVHEYNPTIRVESIKEAIEFLLSLVSILFGFGGKTYNFQNGAIMTASQYVGEKQDKLQELNKQRYEVKQYIEGIVKMVLWSENHFNNMNYDLNMDVYVDFDDTYINDKDSYLLEMRNDCITFGIPQLKKLYFIEKYGLSEEEAEEWVFQEVENDVVR